MSGTQHREALAASFLVRYGNTPGNRQVTITADELRQLIGRVPVKAAKGEESESVEVKPAEPITVASTEARATPKRKTSKRASKRAKKKARRR